MIKEVYSWNVFEEIEKGSKVYAVHKTEDGWELKDADDITVWEWVQHSKEMKFFKESKDE